VARARAAGAAGGARREGRATTSVAAAGEEGVLRRGLRGRGTVRWPRARKVCHLLSRVWPSHRRRGKDMRSASRESSSCVIAARTARSELNKGYATVIIKIHGQMQALHIWSRDVRASLSGVPRTRYFSATALLSDGRRGVAEAAERGRRSPILITSNNVNPSMSSARAPGERTALGLGGDRHCLGEIINDAKRRGII
jgi:hypothetical protein